MPIPATAKTVSNTPLAKTPFARILDAMEVSDGDGHPVQIQPYANPVPSAIKFAQKRNPGRRYVWDRKGLEVRVWRVE
jgi:hypothetical protein